MDETETVSGYPNGEGRASWDEVEEESAPDLDDFLGNASLPETITISLLASEKHTRATRVRLTRPAFRRKLLRHVVGRKEGEAWCPVTFSGDRRSNATAERAEVIVLDVDAGMSAAEARAALKRAGLGGGSASTFGHLAEAPRLRIILFPSRPWQAADYPDRRTALAAYRAGVRAAAAALGIPADPAATDAARLFYLPRHPAGRQPEADWIEGGTIDAWQRPAAGEAEPEPEASAADLPEDVLLSALAAIRNDDRFDRDAWLAVLAGMKKALGERGRDPAEAWSATWSGGPHDPEAFDAAWESLDPRADAGTVLGYARRDGWRDPRHKDAFTEEDVPPEEPAGDDAEDGEGDAEDEASGSKEGAPLLSFRTVAECAAAPRRGYVVKGWIAPRDVCAIVGAPGCGKSALAPLLAFAVAKEEPVFGRRVRRGGVLYVAAEDAIGMAGRLAALRLEHGDAEALVLVDGVSDLFAKRAPQLTELRRAVKERRPALIILDTLADCFPGLDENTAEGMGRVVKIARSLTRYGAAVILIHHDTKSGDGLPCGHSRLNGALDMVLALTRDGQIVRGRLRKNRNGSTEGEIAFRIAAAVLGEDEDGEPVTAAVAQEIDARGLPPREPHLSPAASTALRLLAELIDAEGKEIEPGRRGVTLAAWRKACCAGEELSASEKPDTRRAAFRRACDELEEKAKVVRREGYCLLAVVAGPEAFGDDDV